MIANPAVEEAHGRAAFARKGGIVAGGKGGMKEVRYYRELRKCAVKRVRSMAISQRILDATAGSRMIWFDKENPDVLYMDNRQLTDILCDGRVLNINPDVVADFRDMPFPDNTFYLVVFDPPHLVKAGDNSWLAKKYGVLESTWQEDIRQGFRECMRVLKSNGVLIFKWNEEQIKLSEVLKAIDYKPLFGNRRSKTHWLVFMKD